MSHAKSKLRNVVPVLPLHGPVLEDFQGYSVYSSTNCVHICADTTLKRLLSKGHLSARVFHNLFAVHIVDTCIVGYFYKTETLVDYVPVIIIFSLSSP